MKLLLFIGAGASVELGVPSMRPMLEQFSAHLNDIKLPQDVTTSVTALIGDGSNDMEHLIDLIDRVEAGHSAWPKLGHKVADEQIAPYRVVRGEAEWFVQHCCEQVKTAHAICMWTPLMRAAANHEVTIASTNYDRACEITASRLSIDYDDGFEDFGGREVAFWRGLGKKSGPQLLKLHGSTDWYRAHNDRVLKLRHPVPLFGKLQVVPPESTHGPLQSALILPSREKLATQFPFPDLSAEFRQRAKAADVLVFLGSSLRDAHIRSVCVNHAGEKPTFLVSRSGVFDAVAAGTPVKVIRETGGKFLISTLPRLLNTGNCKILESASMTTAADERNVLSLVVAAHDEARAAIERCTAIEELAEIGVCLQPQEIERMLKCAEPEVSRFALGLIASSADPEGLLKFATLINTEKADAAFEVELAVLRQLLASPTEATQSAA